MPFTDLNKLQSKEIVAILRYLHRGGAHSRATYIKNKAKAQPLLRELEQRARKIALKYNRCPPKFYFHKF